MSKRIMKPPGGESHDIFGQDFNGSPSHHRVLKPPGGGSSDIFGSGNEAFTPRRFARQQQAGSLGMMMAGGGGGAAAGSGAAGGGEEDGAAYTINGAAKNNRSDDSHSRLFGPVNGNQPTPNKNRMKSNIVLGQDSEQAPATNGTNGSPIDGNPVTGNGYPESTNGSVTSNSSNGSNGNSRSRVPPGGFSSGLW